VTGTERYEETIAPQRNDLHVVVLSHLLRPGAQRQIDYLESTMGIWRELSNSGVLVTRLAPAPNGHSAALAQQVSTSGPTVELLSLYPRKPLVFARFPDLKRKLECLKPDIVHVVGEPWQRGVISALHAGRSIGARVGVHFAENGPALHGLGGRFRLRTGQVGLNLAHYAVGWSSGAESLARTVWRVRGPVRAFPSVGIPSDFFQLPPPPWSERRSRVIFVGRLSPEKGISDMLEVANQLAENNVRCAVAGDGPLRRIVETADRDGVVEYLGPIPRSLVARFMSGAAVTLVPSRPGSMPGPFGLKTPCEEQFGLVIVESLAIGTPVVAYRVGAIAEVVGPGGSVVPIGNVSEMVGAIRRLLDDEGCWRRTADRGRTWATQFSDGNIASQLKDLWNELV
jgi:glycosyltransferase involved in cell wall biosynthesis